MTRRAAGRAAPAVHARGQAAHLHHLDRASQRRRAHVRRHAGAQRADRLDARAVGHLVAARHPLHGRDLRLLPADREPALQAAHAHAAQAGARLRPGRACWPRRTRWISTTRDCRNCGTWFIGRLQTERDKLRVIEGLKSAQGGGDDTNLEALMSSLTQRVFLMRNVHDDAPVLHEDALGAVVPARAADRARDHARHGRAQGRCAQHRGAGCRRGSCGSRCHAARARRWARASPSISWRRLRAAAPCSTSP